MVDASVTVTDIRAMPALFHVWFLSISPTFSVQAALYSFFSFLFAEVGIQIVARYYKCGCDDHTNPLDEFHEVF